MKFIFEWELPKDHPNFSGHDDLPDGQEALSRASVRADHPAGSESDRLSRAPDEVSRCTWCEFTSGR